MGYNCQKEIVSLDPVFIKVPSEHCNNHFEMLKVLRDHYKGDVYFFWNDYKREEEQIVSFFEKTNQSQRLIIYSCTSGYPVPFDDVCMLEIIRIKEKFEDRVKDIGFSGHHLGIAIDAAYTLGRLGLNVILP